MDFGTDRHGKRRRRYVASESKAKAAIREHIRRTMKNEAAQTILRRRIGEKADKLTTDDLLDATLALDILDGAAPLATAARDFMARHHPKGGKHLVKDVIADYIAEAEADGLRRTSIKDLKDRLARFDAAFGDTPISDISKRALLDWSQSKHTAKRNGDPVAPLTRRHYMTVIGGLFNYALDQELIVENPLAKRSKRRRKQSGIEDQSMPGIISPADVSAIMLAAAADYPSMLPSLAIGFFAGVRTSELRQLDWQNVNLADRRITIPPTIAKKRSVRHIDIADNLAAWLAPYAQDAGPVAPSERAWRSLFDNVREAAEIGHWPHNAMRHCFATYYLLRTDDADKTALQMGHRDTDLLFNHYRGLATREDAAKFWAIAPKADEKVIRFKNQKAG